MPALPTGLVTFLFTDIEGSTRLWERFPSKMGAAIELHDSILRQAIESHGGHVFKTVGDAFCTVFQSAPDAVQAAVNAQISLLAKFGPWPTSASSELTESDSQNAPADDEVPILGVRMTILTGKAEERNSDYFGPAVNRVSRLLSTAHGGQIILSSSAATAVSEVVPKGMSLVDLGRHLLKDLYDPEDIHQLRHPKLPGEFPPLRSLQAFKHNLPCQLTSFIGREKEMQDVIRLLGASRLLTLTGSGGTGKTRLALQAAAELLEEYPDGIWLVELAALTDQSIVAQSVAACIRVHEEPGIPIFNTLAAELRTRTLLLILDNCEHLLGSCARLAEHLLRTCPEVRILATSREPFQITGETTYRVPSLDLPDPPKPRKTTNLEEFGSVRLFRDRVQTFLPEFNITPDNSDSVAHICRRLDGIPLALELAAARVSAMPVQQIAQRLDQRFSLLTRGSRTALPRQQTLRALIDWSWELLEEDERILWRRLAVFSGGFTLEACEAICPDADGLAIQNPSIRMPVWAKSIHTDALRGKIQNYQVLDLLSQLIDKSLVIAEEHGGAARYRLLETIRQYARDRLEESGEETEVKGRHFEWYLALALEAEPHFEGEGMQEWLNRMDVENDNVRTALTEGEDAESRLRLACAMNRFWFIRGYLTEGREWLERSLAQSDTLDQTLRAKAHNRTGILAWRQGDFVAARNLFTSSHDLHMRDGDKLGAAAALNNLGLVADDEGDLLASRAYHEDALRIYRELGDRKRMGMVLANLGALLIVLKDFEAAAIASREFLAHSQEAEDLWCMAMAWHNLGEIEFYNGNLDAAMELLQDALRTSTKLGDPTQTAHTIFSIGSTAMSKDQLDRAIKLFAAAEALREASDVHLPERDVAANDKTKSEARARAGDQLFGDLWDQGASMTRDEALQLAME